jgi:hypothetical protein
MYIRIDYKDTTERAGAFKPGVLESGTIVEDLTLDEAAMRSAQAEDTVNKETAQGTEWDNSSQANTETLRTYSDVTDENTNSKWFQVPTDDPQTATMLGLCYCHGYNNATKDQINPTWSRLEASVGVISRHEPEVSLIGFMPFGEC